MWTLPALKMVLGEDGPAFRKTLESLCRNEVLSRATRGVYVFADTSRNRRVVFGELIVRQRDR